MERRQPRAVLAGLQSPKHSAPVEKEKSRDGGRVIEARIVYVFIEESSEPLD